MLIKKSNGRKDNRYRERTDLTMRCFSICQLIHAAFCGIGRMAMGRILWRAMAAHRSLMHMRHDRRTQATAHHGRNGQAYGQHRNSTYFKKFHHTI